MPLGTPEGCQARIQKSMIFRILVSGLSLFVLSQHTSSSFIQKYLLLLLPILLIALDFTDNILTFRNGCAQTLDYQTKDKILDVLTYLYAFALFPLDNTVLWLTLFRTLGVALFAVTGASFWLILFLDFVKEYMLYRYVFPSQSQYLPFAVLAKYAFEWLLHTQVNAPYI